MDPVAQLRLTRELIDIDSTTGREGRAGELIASTLHGLGWTVTRQPVSEGRFNIYASAGDPVVVFSTHFDCVPPHLPSRVEDGRLYGRGSCDAKGVLVAQIAAAERLRAEGATDVGLLFVVGEERGSDGARLANTIAPGSKFLVDGEPTDNRLGTSTRGVYRARIAAKGRAAHSSLPAEGESAIEKLVDALVKMRDVEWPEDPDMGRTFYVVGLIDGGIAPNVIPPEAGAEMMFRTVGDHAAVRALIEQHAAGLVTVEDVLVVPPVRLKTVPGIESAAFPFTTDIPLLDAWGEPLLIGPGSVKVAHTSGEFVEIEDLQEAVELYVGVAKSLGAGAS
ncbi:MAG: M20/M25/M40 family metallo-hydrolase [Vicinamibacterales bacterium]